MFAPSHTKGITCICISGNRLFSASEDGAVTIWNITTGIPTRVIRGHEGYVTAVCVTPEGRLYSGGADRHDGASVRSVCIAGGKLYSAGDDKAIVEWDVKLGRPVRTLGGHFGAISTLCAGQDGKLYSGSGDCTVKIWQIYFVAPTASNPAASKPASLNYSTSQNQASDPTVSHLTDEIEYLREQLAKAQELLAKQNRLKFRLKSELTTARTDLVAARSELSTARGVATKVRELEEELSAAKELLVTYKVELSSTQDAHLWALDYILRQSDTSFMDIELEVASMRHLLESPWTPLVKESEGRDSLVAFMPPKATRRVWDADSDWDSDVELDTELAWWRNESHTGSRRRRPESTFSLGTETSDEIELGGAAASIERDTVASRPRPQSIVNRRLQATVEARRRARNDAEHHDGSSPYIVRNSSMLASGGDDAEDAATDDGDDGDTGYDLAEDLFTSDDETTPHARQNVRLPAPAGGGNGRRNAATPTAGSDRTGPYVAEGELISGQPRRASVADPSAAWPSPDRHTPAAAAASVDDLLDWPPPPPPAAPVAADLLGLAEPTSAWVDQATPRRRAEPAVVAPDLLTGEDVASGLLAPSLLPTATVAGGGGAVVPAPQLDRGSPVYTPPSSAANRRPSAVVPRPRSHSLRLASPPTITPIANSASPVPTAPPALPPSSSAASSWLRPLRSFVESIGEQLVPSAPAMEDPFK
ncbi:Transducin (beta)-like 3, partial [Cladochytrium tenue]